MAALRFGLVSESVREGRGWLDFAQQVEESGVGLSYLVADEKVLPVLAEIISGL